MSELRTIARHAGTVLVGQLAQLEPPQVKDLDPRLLTGEDIAAAAAALRARSRRLRSLLVAGGARAPAGRAPSAQGLGLRRRPPRGGAAGLA